jgi:acetylornithine deacetylase/succinyl-diaminopimelate desuccinylase-like protein
VASWARARRIAGLTVDVHRLPGRTPVLVFEIPATDPAAVTDGDAPTVLLYGHLDKQPELGGWRDGLGPWEPVRDGERLYGRGGADDGYAAFAVLAAVEALRAAGGRHARLLALVEASEESASVDLDGHVAALASRIGRPDLVVCLDSGCATYDRLWVTTSLRGHVRFRLGVEVLREGVHSGVGGGIAPDSFRIVRALLSRLEDEATGTVRLSELRVTVPDEHVRAAERTAALLGPDWASAKLPFLPGVSPEPGDTTRLLLAGTWEPALAVLGADGLPPAAAAGNVLRAATTLQIGLRIPPTCDPHDALATVRRVLTADPPHGARVTVAGEAAPGWAAPPMVPWLAAALERAGLASFGTGPASMGEGGSIPFMGMLAERFPDAQYVIAGVLGPESNAHGPNEFLHLGYAQRLTTALALLLHDHAQAHPTAP